MAQKFGNDGDIGDWFSGLADSLKQSDIFQRITWNKYSNIFFLLHRQLIMMGI